MRCSKVARFDKTKGKLKLLWRAAQLSWKTALHYATSLKQHNEAVKRFGINKPLKNVKVNVAFVARDDGLVDFSSCISRKSND